MFLGKYFRAYLVGGFSAIGGFLFGYHTGVISGVLTMKNFKEMVCDNISCSINVTEGYKPLPGYLTGSIVGILLVGCFLGSLIAGQTSDRFSRRYTICVFSIIFTISAIVQTVSRNLWMILVGRFIGGLAIGALSMVVPIYHSEIAATKVRGRIITFQQWAITIGIAISFWTNFGTHSHLKDLQAEWQLPLGLQIIPSTILAIGILFCPFTPRWLISYDREDDARDVLMKIRSASHDEIEEELDRIKNEIAYLRENEINSYRQLFKKPLLRPFLLGTGIQILQQITGINATIYYAPLIFKSLCKLEPSSSICNQTSIDPALLMTGFYGIVNVVATIPTMIFIDKLGRRFLLISGAIIMSISLLIVFILSKSGSDNVAVLICIYIFVFGFAFSWGPIPWVYCTEIFPLTMRAKATSFTTAVNWMTNLIVSFSVSLPTDSDTSNPWTFFVFAILCALMSIIVYSFYPETKNIPLEEYRIITDDKMFVPTWLENKRQSYKTFPSTQQQRNNDQITTSTTNERNSINNSNHIISSNENDRTDEDIPQKTID